MSSSTRSTNLSLATPTHWLLALCLCAALPALACAQRGGGPPGGGMGGPPMGGGMGGGPMRGGAFPGAYRENFVPQRPSGPQLGMPGRWWDDKKMAKTLGLRGDQKERMDSIFNANKATLSTLLSNLQHEEARLEGMTPRELQDEQGIYTQIDRVEAARAELEKENAHILLQIRQQLEPAQLNKLDSEIASLR